MSSPQYIPIDVVRLLPVLDEALLNLLRSLSAEDWQQQTVARLWTVKDVVAHLMDGNIRVLSMLRDQYNGEVAQVNSYQELVEYLNRLNADWVKAMKRVSPAMLLLLHEATGKLFCDYYASLDPFAKATFSVAWAGESESQNWMHIAREYTEKWLHQQQIRDAVGKPGIITKALFHPFMDTFMMALPYTFRDVSADELTTIAIVISGEAGGSWYLQFEKEKWILGKEPVSTPATIVSLDPDTAWKLFSKSLRPTQVQHAVEITGNQALGQTVLSMVSVMA